MYLHGHINAFISLGLQLLVRRQCHNNKYLIIALQFLFVVFANSSNINTPNLAYLKYSVWYH